MLHGRNDSLIPVEQARAFSKRLREVSRQPVAYAELPFAQHAFDIFGSTRAAHAAVAVEQFLAEIYAKIRLGLVRRAWAAFRRADAITCAASSSVSAPAVSSTNSASSGGS